MGLAVVGVLITVSMIVPPLFGWDVHEAGVHPLSATWMPRFGPGTLPSVALGVIAIAWAPRAAERLRWTRLLLVAAAASAAWMIALATVDGWYGLSGVLSKSSEYLPTARGVHDIPAMLREFIDRIPFSAAPHNWPIHVAGHPPGALLFFVVLVRIGLGGNLAAGFVVVAIASTLPVAVVLTLRRLGAGDAARRALPFLVFGPAAIWLAVSADAVFATVAAWGMFLLACAATTDRRPRVIAFGASAGVLLGYCCFLSYGLPLLALISVAVLHSARRWAALPWAVAGAIAVVLAFAVAGFAWWRAYPVLDDRYWAGAAHLRPGAYWTWADLALLGISAGPVVGAVLAAAGRQAVREYRVRRSSVRGHAVGADVRVVVLLMGGAVLAIAFADASQMSRGEVERIWLPFVPWLLIGAALLPGRWRSRALTGQIVFAILVQSLFFARW